MNSKHVSGWLFMSLLVVAASASAQEASQPAPQPAAQPAAGPSPAASVGVLAFPAKGQTAAQQATDESQCYDWSKTQTTKTFPLAKRLRISCVRMSIASP